ncbi:tumor necrosis factor receptor superfamily member 14 [Orussus abietinus]|uniref:tumor necrosis factor receptor superfamily member 14 n=1 Tax=Orussus abietinus TaxID=222816 RepID=UPI000625CA6D|nr:tumor necrosis factor receptor superfamily member 14 [Orussus abietinus]
MRVARISTDQRAFFQVSEGKPHTRHHHGGTHCSRCGPGWGVTSRCSRGKDTECGKCPRGTYSPHHSTQPCWICSRCGPGLYEAHPCTPRADTVCDSCHRRVLDNEDFLRKCKTRANFFLAPEDAQSTGEQSVLVNEPVDGYEGNDRQEILKEDVEAALGGVIDEESNRMQRL